MLLGRMRARSQAMTVPPSNGCISLLFAAESLRDPLGRGKIYLRWCCITPFESAGLIMCAASGTDAP